MIRDLGYPRSYPQRWCEGGRVNRRGRSRKPKATNIGERIVTGEVVKDEGDGSVRILVRHSEIAVEKTVRRIALLPKGQEVRRKRRTIDRGEAERLLWSDESVRTALASRFLSERRGPGYFPDDFAFRRAAQYFFMRSETALRAAGDMPRRRRRGCGAAPSARLTLPGPASPGNAC